MVQNSFSFLIATPERALADKLRDDRGGLIRTQREIASYLFENLRLNHSLFYKMDVEFLGELAEVLSSRKLSLCCRLLERMRSDS